MQVRAFLQLGTSAGKASIGVAVDVATELMLKFNITPKFTLSELRDSISQNSCGCRGQSREFNKLKGIEWSGQKVALKVPVVYLDTFSEHYKQALIKAISGTATNTSLLRTDDQPIYSSLETTTDSYLVDPQRVDSFPDDPSINPVVVDLHSTVDQSDVFPHTVDPSDVNTRSGDPPAHNLRPASNRKRGRSKHIERDNLLQGIMTRSRRACYEYPGYK